MKRYFITTGATEDRPQITCEYGYGQWLDVIKSLKEAGKEFNAYVEERAIYNDYE